MVTAAPIVQLRPSMLSLTCTRRGKHRCAWETHAHAQRIHTKRSRVRMHPKHMRMRIILYSRTCIILPLAATTVSAPVCTSQPPQLPPTPLSLSRLQLRPRPPPPLAVLVQCYCWYYSTLLSLATLVPAPTTQSRDNSHARARVTLLSCVEAHRTWRKKRATDVAKAPCTEQRNEFLHCTSNQTALTQRPAVESTPCTRSSDRAGSYTQGASLHRLQEEMSTAAQCRG